MIRDNVIVLILPCTNGAYSFFSSTGSWFILDFQVCHKSKKPWLLRAEWKAPAQRPKCWGPVSWISTNINKRNTTVWFGFLCLYYVYVTNFKQHQSSEQQTNKRQLHRFVRGEKETKQIMQFEVNGSSLIHWIWRRSPHMLPCWRADYDFVFSFMFLRHVYLCILLSLYAIIVSPSLLILGFRILFRLFEYFNMLCKWIALRSWTNTQCVISLRLIAVIDTFQL